jgi:hypothetical protein
VLATWCANMIGRRIQCLDLGAMGDYDVTIARIIKSLFWKGFNLLECALRRRYKEYIIEFLLSIPFPLLRNRIFIII